MKKSKARIQVEDLYRKNIEESFDASFVAEDPIVDELFLSIKQNTFLLNR